MSTLLKKISYSALMSLLFSLFLFASPSFAKTCKGLSKSACSSSSCTWVKGYTTKKGNNIKAYCRNKGKKSTSSKSKSGTIEKKSETNRLKSKSDKAKKTVEKNALENSEKKAKSSKKGNKPSKSKKTGDKAKKASKKTKKKAEKNKNKQTQSKIKKAKKDKNLTKKKDKQ